MQLDQIQTVRDTFQSILRADYISISDIKQLENLNDYYVFFILVVINSLLGMAFAKSIEFVKRLFTKYKNNFFIELTH